jgi:hypothetical protein
MFTAWYGLSLCIIGINFSFSSVKENSLLVARVCSPATVMSHSTDTV